MSLLYALVGCAGALVTSTCRVCHQQCVRSENHDGACHYHPERWLGAENGKHFGTHTGPGGVPPGLTMFWDCCSKEDINAPGCCTQRHLSYDDNDDNDVLSTALKLRGGARLLPGSGSRLPAVGSLRHAAARLSVPLGPMVVALDFDGVCLDTEPEASRVPWRVRRRRVCAVSGLTRVRPHTVTPAHCLPTACAMRPSPSARHRPVTHLGPGRALLPTRYYQSATYQCATTNALLPKRYLPTELPKRYYQSATTKALLTSCTNQRY